MEEDPIFFLNSASKLVDKTPQCFLYYVSAKRGPVYEIVDGKRAWRKSVLLAWKESLRDLRKDNNFNHLKGESHG